MSNNESHIPESFNKTLSIVFAVAVLISNAAQCVLYFRRLKQNQTIQKALLWMQMNVAMGGITLCASYTGGVLLRFDTVDLTCSLTFLILKYEREIFPFYFGCSLLVQGVYLELKFNRMDWWSSSRSSNWWLWALLPVCLTVLIIVPLVMTDTDCSVDVDWTLGKAKAVEVMYGILPPALAFLLSVAVFLRRPDQSQEVRTQEYLLQTVTGTHVPSAPSQLRVPQVSTVFQPPQSDAFDPNPSLYARGNSHLQSLPPSARQYPHENIIGQNSQLPSYHPQVHPGPNTQQYLQQQYDGQSPPQYLPLIERETFTPASRSLQGVFRAPITSHNVRGFFSVHVKICLVFMLSVMPLSAFNLHLCEDSSLPMKDMLTAFLALYWVKHIYPVLIPLILTSNLRSL